MWHLFNSIKLKPQDNERMNNKGFSNFRLFIADDFSIVEENNLLKYTQNVKKG